MSIIILGDPHIGKNLLQGKVGVGANLNSRVVDQLNLLDWTLNQALEHSADNIIITGDVFEDTKPAYNLIFYFIEWLKKCQAHSVNVHIVIGNHDILRTGNFYSSPLDIISKSEIENTHIYKKPDTIFIDNCAYTFLPFRDRKSFNCETNSEALTILQNIIDYELSSIPRTYKKVLVGHFAIEGAIPVGGEIDDIVNELYCPISMFTGYNYVWMGHVHTPKVMSDKFSPLYVEHVGSMDISNFGESEQEKQIIIIDHTSDQFFTSEKIPTRTLKKISLTIPDDCDPNEYCIEQLQNIKNLDKSIVKLEICNSTAISINKLAIEKILVEQGVYNISTFSESKKSNIIKINDDNSIDNKMDIVSAIKKYGDLYVSDKDKRERFISLALDMCSTELNNGSC